MNTNTKTFGPRTYTSTEEYEIAKLKEGLASLLYHVHEQAEKLADALTAQLASAGLSTATTRSADIARYAIHDAHHLMEIAHAMHVRNSDGGMDDAQDDFLLRCGFYLPYKDEDEAAPVLLQEPHQPPMACWG